MHIPRSFCIIKIVVVTDGVYSLQSYIFVHVYLM